MQVKSLFVSLALALQLSPAAGRAETAAASDAGAQNLLDGSGRLAVAGANGFALDLYKRSIVADRNLFLSPASVSTAVGLAYRGARGVTADELRKAMRYTAPPEEQLATHAPILKALNYVGDGRELRTSNALWIERTLALRLEFAADVANDAEAGIRQVGFKGNPEGARRAINLWVADTTKDRIRDLLSSDDVAESTRAVLVNTIYWKGKWTRPFVASETRNEPFTTLDRSAVSTPLMHLGAPFQVAEGDGVRAIQLPYASGEASLVVLLPDDPSALPRIEHRLSADELKRWLDRLDDAAPRFTILTLPKMHLEWRNDLVPALKALGVRSAFCNSADFSGMADEVKIGKIIHQAFLDVDESGSEAAAATAVVDAVVTSRRRGPPPPPPFIFRADKPFLFLLRDRQTGLILFMGRYVTPAPLPPMPAPAGSPDPAGSHGRNDCLPKAPD